MNNDTDSETDASSAKTKADSAGFESDGMHHPGDDGHTHGTDTRFWLTNDILAFLLSGTLPVIVLANAIGAVDLSSVPSDVLVAWLSFAGIATVWAFGGRAARLWFDRKSGGT